MSFHFLRPEWLWALIPIFLMLVFLLRCQTYNTWQQAIDPHLMDYLINSKNSKKNNAAPWIIGFCWLMAVFALAGPSWQKRPQPIYINDYAKVIVLDLSRSMLAEDIKPSRLTRAKYKILDLLKNYSEGQTALAVFSSEAYTVSPLTNDAHTIAMMVPELSPSIMPVQGQNISAGLLKAERLLKQGGAKTGNIILITDSSPTKKDDLVANNIRSHGYLTSVLAIGTSIGAPIPKASTSRYSNDINQTTPKLAKLDIYGLEALAKEGGGGFTTFTNSNADLNDLMKPILKKKSAKTMQFNDKTNLWYDEGRWFIIFILPFILLSFRKGWLGEWHR